VVPNTSNQKILGATTKVTVFEVTVFPSSEVVIVSGDEIESQGTQFRIFAEAWAKGMHNNRKALNHGVLVTLFSCDDRARIRMVPSQHGGLVVVEWLSFGDNTVIKPGIHHPPDKPVRADCADVSMVTVYKYLDFVGTNDPGRVKEVGIFTHSWPGGPLLFDTDDHSPTIARDPNDFDARDKDFDPANVSPSTPTDTSGWPNLKSAMAGDGRWHIWGCSATTSFHDLIGAAQQHKADGDFALFTVQTTVTNNLHTQNVNEIQERTNRARVLAQIDQEFRSNSYSAAAARFFGIPVFSSGPGLGSSFGSDDFGRQFMFVNSDETPSQFAWYKENFSPEFAPTAAGNDKGYVDYHKIQSRSAPPSAPFSSEFFQFNRDLRAGQTTLTFGNGKSVTMPGVKVSFPKLSSKSGFVAGSAATVTGTLFVCIDTSDDTKSQGFFMQQDGRLFKVTRNVRNEFAIAGAEL
jgi:hypothetical protein